MKKFFGVLVLFAFALVLLGCTQGADNNSNTTPPSTVNTSVTTSPSNPIASMNVSAALDECTAKSSTLEELAICAGSVAVEKNDIIICFNSDSGVMNPYCVAQFAFDKKDISICRDSNNAFGTCLFRYAYLSNDASYCSFEANAWDYSQTSRSDCFTMLATKKSEVYICDQWMMDNAIFNKTSSSASGVTLQALNSETDSCYNTIAMLLNDYSICDSIIPNGNNVSECYMGVAIASSNPSVCEHITNKAFADYCKCSADFSQTEPCKAP